MKKKLFSTLLSVALLIGLTSGCGGEAAQEISSATTASSVVIEIATEAAAENVPAPEISVEASALKDASKLDAVNLTVELPLVDEPTTITYWAGGWDGNEYGLSDPNEVFMTQEYEKRTGIHVEYTTCSYDANAEQASLMFASGDYNDLLPLNYTGGLEKGVEDGVYLDLTDIVEEEAPNYTALRNSDASIYKDSMTDNSRVIAIYEITKSIQPAWYGLLCRADYLEKVDMDVPVTYDDMFNVLSAFKSELGLTNAYQLSSSGYSVLGNCMMAGFDVTQEWYQVDGEVKYGPITDNFKQYLETMNKWYEAGLISEDFVATSPFDTSSIMNGNTGVFAGDYTSCTNYALTMENGARVIAIPEPVVNEGDTIHVGQFNTQASGVGVCISATCENPELVLNFLDYAYSEEGSLLCNYGVEGVTFEYNENGEPVLSEIITANPDGLTFKQALSKYLETGPGVSLYDWERELNGLNQDSIDALEIWYHDGAHLYPEKATPSDKEGEDISAIMSDIETYVSTMILQFITGETSLDEWDSYVSNIENSGINDAIALKQTVLDRYNSR